MALCTDPSLTYLNQEGYNVVKMPRAGIEPLDVLGGEPGKIERLGPLPDIWESESPVPVPDGPKASVDISRQISGAIHLSIGLRILGSIISGFGGQTPQLKAGYKKAKKVVFTFTGTTVTSIDPFPLGTYLSKGDLATDNPMVESFFSDDDKDTFIITEVLKSKTITVSAVDSSGKEVEVDVPVIQDSVGGDLEVKTSTERQGELTYEGQTPITFGFKCYSVAYENGRWVVKGAAEASEDLAFAAPMPGVAPDPIVLERSQRVRLG